MGRNVVDKNFEDKMKLVMKEDEFWMKLRGYEQEMSYFLRTVMSENPDTDYNLDMINLCFKACIAKIINEKDKWTPKSYEFMEFLLSLRPLTIDNPSIEIEDIENIRKEVWGYISYKKDFLFMMVEDYTTDREIDETIEYIEEKSIVLFVCVFAAYIEAALRRLEFSRLEL